MQLLPSGDFSTLFVVCSLLHVRTIQSEQLSKRFRDTPIAI
jgi:hypothetical protein